jgi:hypothetical protein
MSTDTDPIDPMEPRGAAPAPPDPADALEPPTVVDPTGEQPLPVDPQGMDALDALPDLPGIAWPTRRPASGIRVPVPVAGLVLAGVALLGMAGGAHLKSNDQTTAAGGGARNGFAAGSAAGSGATGGQGFAGRGGAGGGVAGTVKAVDGDKVTVTGANGQDTTIVVGADTTVTKTDAGSASDITPGQTLTVRGTAGADGATAATSVIIGSLPGATGRAAAGDGAAPPSSTP